MSKPKIVRLKRLDNTINSLNISALGTTLLRKLTMATLWIRTTVAGAQTLTVPPATGKGGLYRVFIGVTATGNKILKASGSDTFQGTASMCGGTAASFATASNTNTVTLNGTTTGGVLGTVMEIWDIAPGTWSIQVNSIGTGVQVTPFSNT